MNPWLQLSGIFALGIAAAYEELSKGSSVVDSLDRGIERVQSERAKLKFPELRDSES